MKSYGKKSIASVMPWKKPPESLSRVLLGKLLSQIRSFHFSIGRYTEMTNKLEISQLRIEELFNQNRRLTQILPEELVEHVSQCISAAETMLSGRPIDKVNFLIEVGDLLAPKFLNEDDKKALEDATGLTEAEEQKEKLERAEDRVKGLQDELNAVVEESNKMRTMIREDRTGEKEQELEQLKKELVDATTLARNLFGEAMSEVPGQDPTMTLQMRILQLEHSIEQLNDEKEKQKKVMEELQFTIEQKDENNGEVLSELNRLKDVSLLIGAYAYLPRESQGCAAIEDRLTVFF